MTPDHAKSFRVIATLPALTGAAQANETTRQPALKGTITQSIAQLREAEEDYQRGLQAADGIGVTRDYFAAARYYRKAAEKGHGRPRQADDARPACAGAADGRSKTKITASQGR